MKGKDGILDAKECVELGAQLHAQRRSDDVARHVATLDQKLAHGATAAHCETLAQTALRHRVEEPALHQDLADHRHARVGLDGHDFTASEMNPVHAIGPVTGAFAQANEPRHLTSDERSEDVT